MGNSNDGRIYIHGLIVLLIVAILVWFIRTPRVIGHHGLRADHTIIQKQNEEILTKVNLILNKLTKEPLKVEVVNEAL